MYKCDGKSIWKNVSLMDSFPVKEQKKLNNAKRGRSGLVKPVTKAKESARL